jgi:hypothetical protein
MSHTKSRSTTAATAATAADDDEEEVVGVSRVGVLADPVREIKGGEERWLSAVDLGIDMCVRLAPPSPLPWPALPLPPRRNDAAAAEDEEEEDVAADGASEGRLWELHG